MKFGIMQGRLSPKEPHLLQSFPWNSWQKEFVRAESVGFKSIEWLVDKPKWQDNPILTKQGRDDIRKLMHDSNISVKSLCAHYFIDGDLTSEDEKLRDDGITVLNLLIDAAAELGVHNIVLPFFDESSLQNPDNVTYLKSSITNSLNLASNKGINILIESDLDAKEMLKLIDSFNSKTLGVCYDVGNGTSFGFDVISDINELFKYIHEIHIKDRKIHGGSVMLGEGDTPISNVIKYLEKHDFKKPIILETPVGEDWESAAVNHYNYMSSC